MGWPFSRKEYHTRKILGQSVWHSHAIETGLSYTPVGVLVDVVSGNAANNPVVGAVVGVVGGGGGGDDDPPPDNRPLCSSFAVNNLTATELSNFNVLGDGDCKPPNTLSTWLTSERFTFCQDVNNFALNPGGSTCAERNAGQALAVTYCTQSDKIKQLWCTREDLGPDVYARLAGAYCQTDTGKADQWCTCYNVKSGVCDTDPNAAGCEDKALTFDTLVANTPEFFKPQWLGREGCFGACAESAGESKYLPIDETNVCASDINICGGTINADNMTKSAINSTCTIGANTFDPVTGQLQDPAGNPVDNPNKDKDSTNFFTKYFPTSLADLTGDDTNKKIGAGASVSFLLLCCICLIIVIVMLSPGGGSSRFRR